MMHPDEIEEMDYQANAHYDYMREAFGAEARLLAKMAEEDFYWDSERGCDVRDIPTVREQWADDYVQKAMAAFIYFLTELGMASDNIPF